MYTPVKRMELDTSSGMQAGWQMGINQRQEGCMAEFTLMN
jgi:hypothetical protein